MMYNLLSYSDVFTSIVWDKTYMNHDLGDVDCETLTNMEWNGGWDMGLAHLEMEFMMVSA